MQPGSLIFAVRAIVRAVDELLAAKGEVAWKVIPLIACRWVHFKALLTQWRLELRQELLGLEVAPVPSQPLRNLHGSTTPTGTKSDASGLRATINLP
jgi:hypothetical protein